MIHHWNSCSKSTLVVSKQFFFSYSFILNLSFLPLFWILNAAMQYLWYSYIYPFFILVPVIPWFLALSQILSTLLSFLLIFVFSYLVHLIRCDCISRSPGALPFSCFYIISYISSIAGCSIFSSIQTASIVLFSLFNLSLKYSFSDCTVLSSLVYLSHICFDVLL